MRQNVLNASNYLKQYHQQKNSEYQSTVYPLSLQIRILNVILG